MAPEPRERGGANRAARALTAAAAAIGAAALFVVAAVAAVFLHSGTPLARRVVVREANRATAGAFRGTLEVAGLRRFGLGGVTDATVIVHDPQGHVVAVAEGVTVRIGLPGLAWSVLRGHGDIPITLGDVSVSSADVTLIRGPDGEPTIAHAFDPRHPSAPAEKPSRGVRVDLESLRVAQLRAHGQLASFDDFDGRARELAASFIHDETGTTIDVRRLGLEVAGVLPQPVTAHAHAHASLPATGPRHASANVDGTAGGLPVTVRAVLNGDRADATVRALAGGGTVDADASVDLGEVETADVTVTVAGVDPERVVPGAPSAHVDGVADVHARLDPGGALAGELTLHTAPTTVSSQLVPALDARATFTRTRVKGTVHLAEPGAPVEVRFLARHARSATTVDFDARASAADLGAVPQLRAQRAHGSAELHASGRVDLARKRVSAGLEARASGVEVGADTVGAAEVRGRVRGPLEDPRGHVTLHARDIHAAGKALSNVDVDASGRLREPDVGAVVRGPGVPAVDARAQVAFESGVTARDAAVRLAQHGATITGHIARLHAGGGRVEATGVEVDGLGLPIRADLHAGRGAVAARVIAPSVSVPTLMRILGRNEPGRGRLALDADVRADARGASGRIEGTLDARNFFGVHRGRGQLALRLDDRHVDGGVQLELDDARVQANLGDVVLGGPPDEARSWKRATGTVDVSSDVQLATLRRLLPEGSRTPVQEMSGEVAVRAHVARPHPEGAPDLELHVSTQKLALVVVPGAREAQPSYVSQPEEAKPPKRPFRTSGVDVQLSAALEGASNRVTLDGALLDARGPVLRLKVDATPPIAELLRERQELRPLLERMPLEVHAEVPPRELASLPPVLRPAAVRGRVLGTLDVSGQLADPRLKLLAEGKGVASMQSSSAMPFDGTVEATYDGRAAIARVVAMRPEGVVLDLRADIDAPIAQLLSPPPGGPAWDAGATVALHGFPLESIPPVATRGLGGRASGVVELQGLNRDARIDADVALDRPHLGAACFQGGFVRMRIDRDRLIASTRFERPGSFAAATLNAATRWGAAIAPSLDTSQPIDATLQAHDFRASALMPFVQGAVDQLDGRIDTNVHVHVNPDFDTGQFDGELVLSDGVVEVPALGEQLHGVGARLTVRPWGTLRVDDLVAHGPTGKLTGSARAQLDGARIRSATIEVEIPRDERMPLTVEGVPLGEVSGKLHADASMSADQKTLDVAVNVPQAQMNLPSTSGRSLQALDPAPNILIGMYEPPSGRFVVLPQHPPQKPRAPGALEIRTVVDLGKDVRIKRDQNLDIDLTGKPVVVLTDETHVTGTIHLTRGAVTVFGKRFTIEPSSTVGFTGDTSNPNLAVTAMYEAPDNTHIFADVMGTPKSLKVNMRSDPPLPQDEILGLLLFGSPEGLGGTPAPDQQPDPTQRAAGLAGGVVTQGINQALSGITALEISTRVDTTQASNPRPEIDVRISNDILAHVTVQTGMPAPGEPPDRTLLTIDWRFKPRWSLQSTVGDEGSTLFDLLWRHRY